MLRPLLLILVLATADSYKILLLPTPFISHLNFFVPFGQTLVEAGHEVHIVLSSGSKGIDNIANKGIKVVQYHAEDGLCHLTTDQFYAAVSRGMLANPDPRQLAKIVSPAVAKECDSFLKDDKVLKQAMQTKFDLAVVDGLFFARCLYLFPVKLGVPFVTMTTFQEFWMMKVPAMPSHVPFHYAPFTEKMTFMQRLQNTVINIVWVLSSRKSSALSPAIQENYADVLKREDFDSLILKSMLWIFDSDISLDYAKPSMPNVINIGGMSTGPVKPLEQNLGAWMDASTNGVVVASFGSVISTIPLELANRLLSAFAKLPYNVLWGNKNTSGLTLPPNVRAMSWLPQNDVLGHVNTVAFITHCGNNGQFEAVYHRVPMIGLPVFADQPYNGLRIKAKGYGVVVDIRKFEPQELVNAIMQAATNESIRKSLDRGSSVFKSMKSMLKDKVSFWVEHVIKNGGKHLRSHAMDMPFYQYLLIDVFAVLILTIIFMLSLAVYVLKSISESIMKREGKKKTI